MKRHKTVDEFLEAAENFKDELVQLRKIICTTSLEETVKWGAPCYTHRGKLVVGIGSFKSYFGMWFYQGALLEDKKNVLINAQEGKTKALRQWRLSDKSEINARLIKSYIKEAIAIQDNGLEIKPDRNKPLVIPPELKSAFAKNKTAKAKFASLSKGKQREYAEHISDAKREETKLKRVDKILPMIAAGQGLNDKYRDC